MQRPEEYNRHLCLILFYYLETGFSLKEQLTSLARLAGCQVPGMHLPLQPPRAGFIVEHHCAWDVCEGQKRENTSSGVAEGQVFAKSLRLFFKLDGRLGGVF